MSKKYGIYIALSKRDGLVCGLCGESLSTEWEQLRAWRDGKRIKRTSINIDIDHIIPKSTLKGNGWWDNLDNLQLSHITCNNHKGANQ